MPKNKKLISFKSKKIDFEKEVMSKVDLGEIIMRPKWYFLAGSILMFLGLIGLGMGAIFLINLILFLIRRHGLMGQWRLEIILNSFPLWIPILAVLAIAAGIWLLRNYDFSYKKNFILIIIVFISSIIISAWLVDSLGVNEAWSRRGPMRKFYQQLELKNSNFLKREGQRKIEDERTKPSYNQNR